MTIEELASATGLTVGDLEQLESYGLVTGRLVGGVAYYDDDALTVARMAAGLARFGVEARHLRLHKHAAEREAGFIEQIVLPLLKQRNPEARQRALDTVAELTRLGQALRDGAPAQRLARPARRVTGRAGARILHDRDELAVRRRPTRDRESSTPIPTACSWWRS